MLWTKNFETHNDYINYISGNVEEVYYPNVSVCEQQRETHYNDNGIIDEPDRVDYGSITVGSVDTFTYEGGSQSVSLTTASDNKWVVTDKPYWLTVSPSKGTGSTQLTITVDEYEGSKNREGLFTVMLLMPNAKPTYSKTKVTQIRKMDVKTPLTFEITSSGVIRWKTYNTAYTCTIEYSKNSGATWTSITSATGDSAPSISVIAGDTVQFRGNNATYYRDYYTVGRFSDTTCGFKLKGNIMSLINSTGFSATTTLESAYTFQYLFDYCTGLTDASQLTLPCETLINSCYREMFVNCTNLTVGPELPATTLANYCYYRMFGQCKSLTIAPELPATTLYTSCYNHMFEGCTSLISAPELPATTLGNGCYSYMFVSCTSLTTGPSILPATTLTNNCYEYMFSDCTGLTTAPELLATTVASSSCTYMFRSCKNLTRAPELLATTLVQGCYYYMFQSCSKLNYVKCLATNISAYRCIYSWMGGVQTNSGTFVKNPNMSSWPRGTSGIPYNWTIQDAT